MTNLHCAVPAAQAGGERDLSAWDLGGANSFDDQTVDGAAPATQRRESASVASGSANGHSADDMPALLAALDAGEVDEAAFLAALFAAGSKRSSRVGQGLVGHAVAV